MIQNSKFAGTVALVLWQLFSPSLFVFELYVALTLVDILTGIVGAVSREEPLSTKKCMLGVAHKFNRYFYVVVSISIDYLITLQMDSKCTLTTLSVISWLVVNELISITRNISQNDKLPIPPFIVNFFKQEVAKNENNK